MLILGSARSGTSWLGKAFDSHPDVIYRHEPDTAFPGDGLPPACDAEGCLRYAPAAIAYLESMAAVRVLRSVGRPPVIRKRYHSAGQHMIRLSLIAALHAIGKSRLGGRDAARNIQVPDFVGLSSPRLRLVVIKSIDFVDRAGLFARTVPDLRVILLLRDPRAVVASRLRGMRAGKFAADQVPESLVELEPARRRGLTIGQFRALPFAVQIAWDWLTVNEIATEGIIGCANARIVRYREIVEAPEPALRELFNFAGLPWAQETGEFIRASRNANTRGRYYGVYRGRNFDQRAESWDDVVSPEVARQIRNLVADSAPGRLVM
ncbi:MAG: sulfotransferase [Stellaceae bacterium]